MRNAALFVVLLVSSACATVGSREPAVGESRMGAPHEPRPDDCALEFVSVSAADMGPGARFGSGGEFEMVGAVMIGADPGTSAMSESIRRLVRPRACAMGGHVVSLLGDGSGSNAYGVGQQNIVFSVWGKRSGEAPHHLAF